MTKRPKAKSPMLEAVHETASDLHRLGFIDKRKMHELNALCLEPIPEYDSKNIRAVRQRLKISQAVLAAVLNISLSTVRQWEIGEKHPSGPVSETAQPNRPKRSGRAALKPLRDAALAQREIFA